jgi:uncharacterized protein YlxW (UPF0749 family)
MVKAILNSFKSVFGNTKVESKLSDLERVLIDITRENHELKAMYHYQVMDLEQTIEQLRSSCEEQKAINATLSHELREVGSTHLQGL